MDKYRENRIEVLKKNKNQVLSILLLVGAAIGFVGMLLLVWDENWYKTETKIGVVALIVIISIVILIVCCSYNNDIAHECRELDREYISERARIIKRIDEMIQKNIDYIAEFEKEHPDVWRNKCNVTEGNLLRTIYYTGSEICIIPYVRYSSIEEQIPMPKELFPYTNRAKYLKEVEERLARENAYADIHSMAIKIKDIKYYHVVGEMHTTTSISGGGGGGYSLSGAIVGSLVAGEAGAIIGSRQPVNPIVSSTDVHDTRRVELLFRRNSCVDTMVLGYDILDYLKKWLPEKEYTYVLTEKDDIYDDEYDDEEDDDEAYNEPYQDDPSDVKSRLIKLNELKEDGLITKAEYAAKKKEILASI